MDPTTCLPSAAPVPRATEAASLPIAPVHAERQRRATSPHGRPGWTHRVAQAQLAAGTVALYRHAAKVWLQYLEGVVRTDAPTPATVGGFLAALLPGRRPASANTLLAAVRSLYRWTASTDAWPDIGRPVRPVRVSRDGPLPALTHQQVGQLLASVVGDHLQARRDRAVLAVLYTSGARGISLHRADVRHFDAAAGTLAHQAKGRRDADSVAYLPPSAAALLADYLRARALLDPVDASSPLFATCDRRTWGARMGVRSIRNVVVGMLERAGHRRRGIDGRLASPNTWGAHTIRRSALTTTADHHGLEAARALAGHASVETTRRAYVRAKLDGQLREVAASLDLPVSIKA